MKLLLSISLILFAYTLHAQQDTTHVRFRFQHLQIHLHRTKSNIPLPNFLPDYGMFVLSRSTPPLTTTAQRIARVKSFHLKWYRLNFSYTGGSSLTNLISTIQQLHDSGLQVQLTYNETQLMTQGGDGSFASDTAAMGMHLDYVFSVVQPEVVVCYNEPSTRAYFTDTAANYIPAMLCMIKHAHKYGVKVSAYTSTTTAVYALYYYYQSHGKTDSLTWLQGLTGIHDISGPVAQHAIFFFNTVMPAVASSNADYTDVHYYAPWGSDDTDTSWNDLFRVLIGFIRSQSGKEVTVTEFGTDNNSEYLLFQFLGEMARLHITVQIYYDGDDSGPAINLADDYYDYIFPSP